MSRILKTTLAGLGFLIFLAGVFPSIHRTRISSTLFLFSYREISNEIPNFLIELQCPESMGINQSHQITAIIRDRASSASTHKVHLHGTVFDVVPLEPVEVNIPEGGNVELSWIIKAKEMGVQSLGVPVNSWDEAKCSIVVREEPWMEFQTGRILSLICLLISTIIMTPWDGLSRIRFTKKFGFSLLPSIIFISIITRQSQSPIGSNELFWLTLIYVIPVILTWYVAMWHPECGVVRLKGTSFSIGFVIFTFCYFFFVITQIPWSNPGSEINAVSIPSIYLNPSVLLIVPSAILFFLYPRMEPTWDLSWDEVSSTEKAIRLLIFLFACPIVLVHFLLAVSESFLVFFG